MTAIFTFANLTGAVFVFTYLVVIAPRQYVSHGWVADAIAFSVYAVVAFTLEAWWSEVSWRRALGWFAGQGEPTPEEQDATLRLPLFEGSRSFVAWAVASVFFPVHSLLFGAPAG